MHATNATKITTSFFIIAIFHFFFLSHKYLVELLKTWFSSHCGVSCMKDTMEVFILLLYHELCCLMFRCRRRWLHLWFRDSSWHNCNARIWLRFEFIITYNYDCIILQFAWNYICILDLLVAILLVKDFFNKLILIFYFLSSKYFLNSSVTMTFIVTVLFNWIPIFFPFSPHLRG